LAVAPLFFFFFSLKRERYIERLGSIDESTAVDKLGGSVDIEGQSVEIRGKPVRPFLSSVKGLG